MNDLARTLGILIWSGGRLLPFALATASFADCKLGLELDIPVTMDGLRPLVAAKVDGQDARFLVDSGAFYSVLGSAAAAQFKLHLDPSPIGPHVEFIDGAVTVKLAKVHVFTLAELPLHNVEFLVGGDLGHGDYAGFLGQNVFGVTDVDYDFANGRMKIMRPLDCGETGLAYWARGVTVSVLSIDHTTPWSPHLVADASINGVPIRVVFDTGSAVSLLSLRAARRAGVAEHDSAGNQGDSIQSSARRLVSVKSWIAPISSFNIGEEEIRNTKIRVANTNLPVGDMLLGADFFLSHHVYVAHSQSKIYFTYNGGPIFNLTWSMPNPSGGAPPATSGTLAGNDAVEPQNAADFARRAAAFKARRNFAQAIADYTRASELAPNETDYLLERAKIRWQTGDVKQARADIDLAATLSPGDAKAPLLRAQWRVTAGDSTGVREDLQLAEQGLTPDSDLRLQIADLYWDTNHFDDAVRQYDLWIASHQKDGRLADAFYRRSRALALLNKDLHKALDDANAALTLNSKEGQYLTTRGLVHLRLGRLKKAIDDFDVALFRKDASAWPLYLRGIAKLQHGMTEAGLTDIDAAVKVQANIAEEAGKYGIEPPPARAEPTQANL